MDKYKAQKDYLSDPDKVKKITITLTHGEQADVIDFWEHLPNKRQWFIDAARAAMSTSSNPL